MRRVIICYFGYYCLDLLFIYLIDSNEFFPVCPRSVRFMILCRSQPNGKKEKRKTTINKTNQLESDTLYVLQQPGSCATDFVMVKDGSYEEAEASSIYNRPRRPNVDTIAYLRGLPLDIEDAKKEIDGFLQDSDDTGSVEYPQSLAAALSAIDEIRLEIASLAGDEHGSQCIEAFAHIAAPYSEVAARVLLAGCSGYHLHLATHRYGSHVVQTILQLAVSYSSKSDLALHDEAPQFTETNDSLPTLSALIYAMVEELSPHCETLAVHVCGSHVLRTLLCVLGGVDLVCSPGSSKEKMESGAFLRGRKKSKKKKKRKPSAEDDSSSTPHAGTMHVIYRKDSRINTADLGSLLESLTLGIMGTPSNEPGELQQFAIHPSAGPLLIVLLRVLTYSSKSVQKEWKGEQRDAIADFRLGISRKEPTFESGSLAHQLTKRILCWEDGSSEQRHVGDVIYGLSGEPRGSHLLETLLRLVPDDLHASIVKFGDFESPNSMQDYVEHNVSNFVIQTLLTTIRSKEQAESILKVIEKVISNGLAVDSAKKRRGILWRAAELSAKFRVGQESLLKAVRLGFASTNAATETKETSEGKKKKQRKKASTVEVKDCVLRLLDLRRPDKDGARIILDAAGARSLYHMLRFTPRLCEEILKGIIDELAAEDLLLITKDGLASRCIMDGILDGPVKTPIFIAATRSLLTKLKGHWVSLSTDRVGCHTVKKMFVALPKIDDKAKLVEELVGGGNRMNGNVMGRSVVGACFVEQYRDNRKDWRRIVSKMMTKEEGPLDEIISATKNEGSESRNKAKRKRKRKNSGKEAVGSEERPTKKSQQNSKAGSFTVESIVKAMSLP